MDNLELKRPASQRFTVIFLRKAKKEIARETGGSTITVTRVAHWLDQGMNEYKTILTRLFGSSKRSKRFS